MGIYMKTWCEMLGVRPLWVSAGNCKLDGFWWSCSLNLWPGGLGQLCLSFFRVSLAKSPAGV